MASLTVGKLDAALLQEGIQVPSCRGLPRLIRLANIAGLFCRQDGERRLSLGQHLFQTCCGWS